MKLTMEGFYLLDNNYSGYQLLYCKDNKVMKMQTIPANYVSGMPVLQPTHYSFDVDQSESILESVFKKGESYFGISHLTLINELTLTKLDISPGQYHPHIFRPVLEETKPLPTFGPWGMSTMPDENPANYLPYNIHAFHQSLNQLATIKEMLQSILNNVYPDKSNLDTYGHTIKNLLVISCIEVEAQLKGILKANEKADKKNYKTKDYVVLKDILKLNEYSIQLSPYPALPPINPFKDWDVISSSGSLNWFDSYNGIKHNSYEEFHKASLRNALSAVCAAVALLFAQYGHRILGNESIGSFFRIDQLPKWGVQEHYLSPFSGSNWTEKKVGL
jgi:hypothetical protein